mmetsp:Transcript_18519/g.24185  ORF Transcript_18519/g.24185 Transcript_18519/m.24185 type:complete len:269 (-) Transcript_18519:70-876(-)
MSLNPFRIRGANLARIARQGRYDVGATKSSHISTPSVVFRRGFFSRFLGGGGDGSKEADRLKRSKAIRDEMQTRVRQGPFYRFGAEWNEIGDRVFKTPEKLFAKKHSVVLPPLTVETLAGNEVTIPPVSGNKPTLLLVSFNDLGSRMAQSWKDPVDRHFEYESEEESSFRVLELFVVEGWHFKLFPDMMSNLMKRSVPLNRHEHVASFPGDFNSYKEVLNIKNTFVCYVYLIDSKGRIRWRADGEAEMQDALLLVENLKSICSESTNK